MTTVDELLCGGLFHRMGFDVAGFWCLLSPLLGVSFVELIAWCSGVA